MYMFRLISDHEKLAVRQRCLSLLGDEDDTVCIRCSHQRHLVYSPQSQIEKYNEIILSKIARHDYPNNWYIYDLTSSNVS